MHKLFIATVAAAAVVSSASTVARGGEYQDVFIVEESTEAPTVVVSGTVVPFKEVTLAAQLPGRVKFIAGVEGEAFDSGTTLIALDEDELLANRSSAYAQLAAADAEMRNANVQYSRELWSPQSSSGPGGMGIPNLFDQMFTRPAEGFLGQRDRGAERSADLYASSTRMEQARSAMLRAQSEIRAIDAKLRDAKSLAPFDGVIVEKYVEEGDTVQPGQPMLKFADMTWLQIEVDVPARLAQGLQPMSVLPDAATFDDYPDPVAVRVAQVFPMADMQSYTIKVKFDIPQGVSQPGMYARVLIPDTSGPVKSQLPIIPSTAIRYRGSLPVVYIQNENGEPELRMIRQGKRLENGMTMVLSGIAPGDRVYPNPGPDLMARSRAQ
ncbi:MAG: efflux RND transporter periplasmic adaptor subunit [Sedimenticolaceae bacterium]